MPVAVEVNRPVVAFMVPFPVSAVTLYVAFTV